MRSRFIARGAVRAPFAKALGACAPASRPALIPFAPATEPAHARLTQVKLARNLRGYDVARKAAFLDAFQPRRSRTP